VEQYLQMTEWAKERNGNKGSFIACLLVLPILKWYQQIMNNVWIELAKWIFIWLTHSYSNKSKNLYSCRFEKHFVHLVIFLLKVERRIFYIICSETSFAMKNDWNETLSFMNSNATYHYKNRDSSLKQNSKKCFLHSLFNLIWILKNIQYEKM
jgi:hypothetical protein